MLLLENSVLLGLPNSKNITAKGHHISSGVKYSFSHYIHYYEILFEQNSQNIFIRKCNFPETYEASLKCCPMMLIVFWHQKNLVSKKYLSTRITILKDESNQLKNIA